MSTEQEVPKTKKETFELIKASLPEVKQLIKLNAREGADIETMALQEFEYFRQQAQFKPEFLECLPATIIMAIKSVIRKNLSLDPSAGLVYIKTRNMKVTAQDGSEKWVKALEIQESANGLLSIARQCGRVLDFVRPKVKKDDTGKVIEVSFRYMVPSYNEHGKASTRWEEVDFDESDFLRWRKASHNENGRKKSDANADTMNYANPNYTSWKGGLDPEFARAKAVRHGLKKLGTNTNEINFRKLNTGTIDIEHEIVVDPIKDRDYIQEDDRGGEGWKEPDHSNESPENGAEDIQQPETVNEPTEQNNIQSLDTITL
jgi:hypothetical protein